MRDFVRPLPGNYLRWNEATWVIRFQRNGVLHLEMLGGRDTEKLRLGAWQQGCEAGSIVMLQDPTAELPEHLRDLATIQFAALPESMQAEVLRRRQYIEAFLDPVRFYTKHLPDLPVDRRHLPRSLSPKQVDPFFLDVAQTFKTPSRALADEPPGSTTFRAWLKRWEKYKDWNMMAPRFDRRGPPERLLLKGPLKTIADRAIKKVWLTKNKFKKKDVWEEVEFKLSAWNAKHPNSPPLQISRRQVERYIDEAVDKYDTAVARYGKDYANKRFEPVMQGPVPDYIFDLLEVDHTRAKVEVCDDETGLPLGRPWITAALDKRSRMVAGIHVHFEGQSLNAVMQALRNTMQSKQYLKMLLPDLDYEYTVCGIPIAYFFDRGDDFDNDHVQEVGLNLHIHIEYAPGEHPEYKGSLERFFGTLHQNVALNLPGARPRVNRRDEGARNSAPKITFTDFYARLWRWIALVYSKDFHTGIDDVPLDRWREGEGVRAPRPPRSREFTDPILIRAVRCKASREGVQHQGLFWNGDPIKTILSHPNHRVGSDVLVRIDDSDLGRAFVMDPVTRQLSVLAPVLKNYMPGTTWFQHSLVLRKIEKKRKGTHSERSLMQAKAELRDEALSLLHNPATGSKTRERLARLLGIGRLAPAGKDLGSIDPRSDVVGVATPRPKTKPGKMARAAVTTPPNQSPKEQPTRDPNEPTRRTADRARELPDHE